MSNSMVENEVEVMEAIPSREFCSRCRSYSVISFAVSNEIWRMVVPERFREDILCLLCFARMADERLVKWDADIEFYPVSLAALRERHPPTAYTK